MKPTWWERCWRNYWSTLESGGHRDASPAALQRDANMKLSLLPSAGKLLDIGCGTGELSIYFAPAFESLVCIEPSPTMRKVAGERFAASGMDGKICLLDGNHRLLTVRNCGPFTAIIANQVAQYLDIPQLSELLNAARSLIADEGRLLLADIPDPDGLTKARIAWSGGGLSGRLRTYLTHVLTRCGLPGDGMGCGHDVTRLSSLALSLGWKTTRITSSLYDYRYHLVLEPGHGYP